MGTTADKLNRLIDTKSAIKSAINSKGVVVDDSVTFNDYASKINQIETNQYEYLSEFGFDSDYIDRQKQSWEIGLEYARTLKQSGKAPITCMENKDLIIFPDGLDFSDVPTTNSYFNNSRVKYIKQFTMIKGCHYTFQSVNLLGDVMIDIAGDIALDKNEIRIGGMFSNASVDGDITLKFNPKSYYWQYGSNSGAFIGANFYKLNPHQDNVNDIWNLTLPKSTTDSSSMFGNPNGYNSKIEEVNIKMNLGRYMTYAFARNNNLKKIRWIDVSNLKHYDGYDGKYMNLIFQNCEKLEEVEIFGLKEGISLEDTIINQQSFLYMMRNAQVAEPPTTDGYVQATISVTKSVFESYSEEAKNEILSLAAQKNYTIALY